MANASDTAIMIINQVLSNSNTLIEDARTFSSNAINDLDDLRSNIPEALGSSSFPNLIQYDPSQFNPTQDLRGDFDAKYQEMLDKLTPMAKKEFNEIMAKLFPSDAVWNELGNYLNDSIKNGNIGIPEHIENQIWQRLRDRENIQYKTALNTAHNDISSRGFSIPPGFIEGASVSLLNNVNKNLSSQNRDVAIRIAELKIEWAKFAIQNIIDMRKVALQNALEFMNNIYKSASTAQAKASGYVSSYQSFYSSINAYVNAISSINELRVRMDATNKDYNINRAKVQADVEVGISKIKAENIVEVVKSMGVLAASASSGVNALGSVTDNVNTTI